MAGKNVKVKIDLDFTADNMSIDKIREKMDLAFKAIKINLDPASVKKMEADLKEIGKIAERSLNKSTGKINLKKMDVGFSNSETLGSIEEIRAGFIKAGIDGSKSLDAISVANNHMERGLKDSNSVLTKMGTTLANTIRWNISASAINAVTGEFQKMYGFSKDLDRSLTDIRIVSGLSADNMARFAIEANKSAKALKVSTIDYVDASLVFYQQGLKAIEVQNMTKAAIIGGNITGQSTEEMSNLLTSVMNGYKIATEDVLKVTDKLAAVGATTAADFYELATAMSKVASMANAAGVPLDQLNAQIATIVSVTKESPESIGTSLKTIYGRMLAFKVDTKALMKDEDGEVFGAPKVEEALEAFNKVTGAQLSLFKVTSDGKREVRDLGEVINEIGNSWDLTTDKAAKFGLATALAGSRQQNRLVALFDAWDMYQGAVTTSLEAEGTSLRQNEIYMESYAGKIEGLKAAKEELYMTMVDSDSMKTFVDGLTTAVSLFTKLADAAGGLDAVIGVIGASFAKSGVLKLSQMLPSMSLGGIAAKKNDHTQKEIEETKKLQAIKNMYGSEEANRIRKQIIDADKLVLSAKKKQDLLFAEREALEQVKVILQNKNMEEGKQTALINIITQRAAALNIETRQIESVVAAERLLSEEKNKLGELHKRANQGIRAEFEDDIRNQRIKIEELQAMIDGIDNDIESKLGKNAVAINIEQTKKNNAEAEFQAAALQAERLHRATQLVQTTMMMLPSVMGVATDRSKDMGDVLKAAGTMAVPMLLQGFTALIPAISAAAASAGGLTLAVLAPIAPLVGLIALITALGVAIKKNEERTVTFKEALDELDQARSNVEQLESTFENTTETLKQMEERIREINKLLKAGDLPSGRSAALEKELGLLNTKRSALKEELIIQELILDNARKKAEEAAKEAATATMKSDYQKKLGTLAKEDVDVSTELNNSIDAFKRAEHTISNYQGRIKALSVDSLTYDADLKKLNESIEKQEKLKAKAREDMALHSSTIRQLITDLGGETGANRELVLVLQTVLDRSLDVSEGMLTMSGAMDASVVDEINNSFENAVVTMEDLAEAYSDSSDKLQTYYEILGEVNSKEGMSAKTKQAIILKHAELLPYIDDEIALRKKLTEIIKEEEKVQLAAYHQMIMSSEEFYNAKIKGQNTMVDELAKAYDADLSNVKSLAEAKAKVEEALINHLAKQWEKFYSASADAAGEYVITMGQGGAINSEGLNMAKQVYFQMNEIENKFKTIVGSFKSPDFKAINSGASDKKGSSDKAKKEKEAYEAIANAYEAINFALDRNNVLLDINKQNQSEIVRGSQEHFALLDEEIRLRKERQTLLHEYNEALRAEGQLLQAGLSSTFKFEGSWDDNSVMITNMEAINGKSKEMEEDFKRIIEIMKELPKASAEWAKLNAELKAIDISKLLIQFELADQKLNKLQKTLSTLEYEFRLLEGSDVDGKVENIVRQIENLEQQLIDAQVELKSLGEVGEQSPQAIRDRFEELTKRIQDSTLAVKTLEKSLIDMREALRVEHVKKLNDAYSEQQDRLSKLESIQENIVQIIRKRGEEEKKQLDENHNAEMKSLDERHNKRIKMYKDDLDEFTKTIQAKIDLLEDEWEEEDYIDELNKEREIANNIQRQIDVLSLDDSLTAKNKVIALNKDLAKQNEKIATMQKNKERKLQKELYQDQVKDKEKATDKIIDIENESYEEQKKFYEEDYNNHKKYLDWKYSDEQVYAEARASIMRDQVEVSEGVFMDIYDAFVDFEDKFGRGMGILGDIIKDEFNDSLREAQRLLKETANLSRGLLDKPDPDRDYPDDEIGWKDPPRDKPNSENSDGIYMSREDFSQYRVYKMLYEAAQRSNDSATMDETYRLMSEMRRNYGITGDKYSFDDLKGKSYNDVRFKKGGLTDKTGIHILDGEPGKPERVLSQQQTTSYDKFVFEDMPKLQGMLKTFDSSNFQNLLKSAVLSRVNVPRLNISNISPKQGITLQIDNFIKADNITKDSIPELRKIQADAMEDLKNLLNKNGVRPSLI